MGAGSSDASGFILVGFISLILLAQVDGRRTVKRDILSSKVSVLDMAHSSFDDQYKGCGAAMEEEAPRLLEKELTMSKDFADAWNTAKGKWAEKRNVVLPQGFKEEYAIALMAYTVNSPLHKVFNEAVREAGRSKEYYLRNFNFKAFHYYLTKALQMLDAVETPACHKVFRGIRGVQFKALNQTLIRFGQFTSSSMNDQNALQFGEDTFFTINTCYGVNIKNFSFFPGEEEVLIPPFEKFKVTNFTKERTRNLITLQSLEKSSVHNCELAKDRRCKTKWCPFNSATSTRVKDFWDVALIIGLILLSMGPGGLCT